MAQGPISRLLAGVPEVPTQAQAQEGLRDVLGDPTLELLWIDQAGAYVTAEGDQTALPEPTARRVVTPITHERRTVGALVHDSALLDDPALGEVSAVIGLAIEKDRINELLRWQRDLLSGIGDATPAVLCVIRADGKIMPEGMNQAGRDLLGETHAQLSGRFFWEAVAVAEERAAVEEVIRTVVGGEPQPERVSRWRTPAGSALVAWTCIPLGDVAPFPVFLISGTDVTERERQAQELRDSRMRIVRAGDTERRRLERNLHDGAQQRLVSLALALRRAEGSLTSAPSETAALLHEASRDLSEAIRELRELASGLHPVLLTERGLAAAVRALAERATVPVTVQSSVPGRLPESTEAAAYFVVAETLTNAAKHSRAASVTIELAVRDDVLVVSVADDGVGGAAADGGSGLRGLVDRVEAMSGRFTVVSSSSGTRCTAEIPLDVGGSAPSSAVEPAGA